MVYVSIRVFLVLQVNHNCKAGYTLFENHNKTQTKRKFAKHDKNHATHYLLIIQSFTPKFTTSVCAKSPFEFVMETTRLPKQNEPSFAKNISQNATKYLLHTIRGAYQFYCGLRIMCSPLNNLTSVCNMVTSACSSQCQYAVIASKECYAPKLHMLVTCEDGYTYCNLLQCYKQMLRISVTLGAIH